MDVAGNNEDRNFPSLVKHTSFFEVYLEKASESGERRGCPRVNSSKDR